VPDWIKVKTFKSQDVVVGGWTTGRGERVGGLGALLLGVPGPDGLRYVGKVGTGFSDADRQHLLGLLDPLRTAAAPFTEPVPAADAKSATFVRPEVVGEVAYAHWTNAGRLRHPVWRGLRLDKAAADVTVEEDADTGAGARADDDPGGQDAPAEAPSSSVPASAPRGRAKTGGRSESVRVTVGGQELSVSNLDKVLYPATGFTKGQLIDYYVRAATAMLPHVRDRVLTMKRFPDGVEGKFFFEKHVPSHAPKWVRTITVPSESHGSIDYAVVDDLPTLVWAANLGAIEFHVPLWSAGRRKAIPGNPDFIVFDLDPGEGTSIVECCTVAELVVPLLERQGHEVCAKTSGMKGLQLYARLRARTSWDQSRDQARDIAQQLEKENPRLVVSKMTRSLRKGRVLIDWSQNHPAKTTICVYSVRASDRPTVSTPVTLAEVHDCATRGDPMRLRFDTDAALARIEQLGDLFAPLLKG
jgi:bifunctional non-homologous end joining protein LigD